MSNRAVGEIKIGFTAGETKEYLLENFSEFLTVSGTIKLVNSNGDTIELDVCDIEYTEFDEDSDY